MKEFLGHIDNEDYHRIVYPTIVSGDNVMQMTLDGEYLIYPNPERYPSTPIEPPKEEPQIIKTNGVQAAFHPFHHDREILRKSA